MGVTTNWEPQTNLRYPTLAALNDIVREDIYDQLQQLDHNDSIASFRVVHLNIFPVAHSAKLQGHIIATPHKQWPPRNRWQRPDRWY